MLIHAGAEERYGTFQRDQLEDLRAAGVGGPLPEEFHFNVVEATNTPGAPPPTEEEIALKRLEKELKRKEKEAKKALAEAAAAAAAERQL